jgi:transcriptional regulator with XRE-family HTH domain
MTSDDLKEWRERLKLSLDKAAKELGCSKSTLIAYERGRRIPHYIALACAAYALGVKAIGSDK